MLVNGEWSRNKSTHFLSACTAPGASIGYKKGLKVVLSMRDERLSRLTTLTFSIIRLETLSLLLEAGKINASEPALKLSHDAPAIIYRF
jgi:hypothetical protein